LGRPVKIEKRIIKEIPKLQPLRVIELVLPITIILIAIKMSLLHIPICHPLEEGLE
jgi:hypothetical protein